MVEHLTSMHKDYGLDSQDCTKMEEGGGKEGGRGQNVVLWFLLL